MKKDFSILIDLATEICSVGGLTIRVSAIVKPKVTKCLYVLVRNKKNPFILKERINGFS